MATKRYNDDGMGEAAPGQVQSPLSFQRTDGASVDSLLEPRPEPSSYKPPMDSAGFIPKNSGMGNTVGRGKK
jgi:hypothetical protein